jgi:hypothetical protein
MEKTPESVEELSPWSSASSADNEHPPHISKRHTPKVLHGDIIAPSQVFESDWTNSEKGNSPAPNCSGGEQPSRTVQPEPLRQRLEQLKSDQELDHKIKQLEQELAQEKGPESQPESEPNLSQRRTVMKRTWVRSPTNNKHRIYRSCNLSISPPRQARAPS